MRYINIYIYMRYINIYGLQLTLFRETRSILFEWSKKALRPLK